MKNRFLVLTALICAANSYGADGSTSSAARRPIYAVHNPTGAAFAQVSSEGDHEYTTIFWLFQPTFDVCGHKDVRLKDNELCIGGKDCLGGKVSLFVSGGAAVDPFKGPEDQPRTFDYRPAARFFVLRNVAKQAGYTREKIEDMLPEHIQQAESIAAVLAYYKGSQEPALIIDLHAALDCCNRRWRDEDPVRQIPEILSIWRGNVSCMPYREVTQAGLRAYLESDDAKQAAGAQTTSHGCSIQ